MSRLKNMLRGVSGRFVVMYLLAFIIPLGAFTVISYRYTDASAQNRLMSDNDRHMRRAVSLIEENMDACRSVANVAASSRDFIDFATGDMTSDMLELIWFKFGEYSRMESLKFVNPRISNIRFFLNNPKLYELYGILYNEDRLGPLDMGGESGKMLAARADSRLPANQPADEAAYYMELRGASGHIGFLEVCMRQSVLFEPAYLNDPATLTIIETGGGTLLYNRGVLDADAGELAECLAGVPARDDKPAFVTIRGKIYAAAKTAVPSVNAALYQLTSRESAAGDLRGTRTALLAAVLISTVLFFIALREMIRRLLNERDAARDSELKALQAQIHSHFVYNILESLRMMAELHKETEISGAIANLCKLMRYSVNWKDQEVTLRGELDMVRGYVDLINLISDTPVTLEIDQSAGSDGLMIPKMCIQPLVENSVNHGFDPLGENGLIRITVRAQNGSAVVDVYDTGTGLTETELARVKNMLEGNGNADPARSRSGIGLDNVNERLSLKYGGKNTIRVDSVYGEYTRVSFSIPISVTGDTV